MIVYIIVKNVHHFNLSKLSERGLGSGEDSSASYLIDSEMAGPIKLKLGGMVESMQENILAKEFL